MGRGISPEEFAIKVNTLRKETSPLAIYNMEEIVSLLKKYDLPSCSVYLAGYIEHGIIIRIQRSEYQFPANPIYVGTIKKVLSCIREKHKNQMQFSDDKEKIAKYVDFLKSKGFLVLKQM